MDIKQEVKKARKGDHEAFTRIVLSMKMKMYGLAYSILRSNDDCADAMQETILKAYKSLHTLKKPEYFQSWIFRILINECNQLLRNKSRLVPVENFDHIAKHKPETEYEAIAIREAVEQLDESLRMVVHLFYFQDMSMRSVGEVLGIKEGAVKGRLFRARQQLLHILGESPERRVAHESK